MRVNNETKTNILEDWEILRQNISKYLALPSNPQLGLDAKLDIEAILQLISQQIHDHEKGGQHSEEPSERIIDNIKDLGEIFLHFELTPCLSLLSMFVGKFNLKPINTQVNSFND